MAEGRRVDQASVAPEGTGRIRAAGEGALVDARVDPQRLGPSEDLFEPGLSLRQALGPVTLGGHVLVRGAGVVDPVAVMRGGHVLAQVEGDELHDLS